MSSEDGTRYANAVLLVDDVMNPNVDLVEAFATRGAGWDYGTWGAFYILLATHFGEFTGLAVLARDADNAGFFGIDPGRAPVSAAQQFLVAVLNQEHSSALMLLTSNIRDDIEGDFIRMVRQTVVRIAAGDSLVFPEPRKISMGPFDLSDFLS